MNRTNWFWVVILVLVIVGGIMFVANRTNQSSQSAPEIKNISNNMQITSSDFQNNGPIPSKFTCDGQNINPEISISGVPAGAKSLAFILHDPDAPLPGGFTHWVMFNIDPKTSQIAQHSVPAGAVQGSNGAGQAAYIGPCPPSGVHHYHFIFYALDTTLSLNSSAKKADLEQAVSGHILDQGLLIGTYKKISK